MNLAALTYHYFHRDKPRGIKKADYPFSVRLDDLELHCQQLQSSDLYLIEPDLITKPDLYRNKPERQLIVTVDDGHESLEDAVELFIKHKITPVLNIVPGFVGSDHFLGWSSLRDLASRRISIQSHSMSHFDLTTLKPMELKAELEHSKKSIEDNIGLPGTMFAAPMGRINQRVIEMAKDAGYSVIMTSFTGINKGLSDLYQLKRFQVKNQERSLPLQGYYSPLSKVRLTGTAKNLAKKIIGGLKIQNSGIRSKS
jgi:peptidoglycan/xylan/chitin deacetylase (PgdA/CDA1 family)